MSRLWRTHGRTVESSAVFSLSWIRNKSDMEILIIFVDIEIIKKIMEIGILFVDTSNQTACLALSSYWFRLISSAPRSPNTTATRPQDHHCQSQNSTYLSHTYCQVNSLQQDLNITCIGTFSIISLNRKISLIISLTYCQVNNHLHHQNETST